MNFFLLINVKMATIVGILTFISVKNSSLGSSEPKKELNFLTLLCSRAFKISCSSDLSMKKFYNLGACSNKKSVDYDVSVLQRES